MVRRISPEIVITFRRTGVPIVYCESWAEVFAWDVPIGSIGVVNGQIEVRTRAFDDERMRPFTW